MKKIITALLLIVVLAGCTENQQARSFGGTETILLEPQERFINITWKQDDIWIVVQDTITGQFYAREKSSFGMMEGKIIIGKK